MTTTHELPADAFRRDRHNPGHIGADLHIDGVGLAILVDEIRQQMHTMAVQIERLEARTAMDEPDPEPVTAGEGDKLFQFGRFCNKVDTETWSEDGATILGKAIDLGLAVSPDDPRLQPLRPEPDITIDVLRRLKSRGEGHINPSVVSVVAAAVIAHLNERSAQCQTGTGGPVPATNIVPSAAATRRSAQ